MERDDALDRLQRPHPLTCGGDRCDPCHREYQLAHGGDLGELSWDGRELVCPACGWKQPPSVGHQLAAAKARIKELELKSEPYCRCGRGNRQSQSSGESASRDILQSLEIRLAANHGNTPTYDTYLQRMAANEIRRLRSEVETMSRRSA